MSQMTSNDRAKLAKRLVRRGFDETYRCDGAVYPKCSQCEALVINGMACHEQGCPRERKYDRD